MRTLISVASLVLLSSCYQEEYQFINAAAKLECTRQKVCFGETYADQYDDRAECRNEVEEGLDAIGDFSDFVGQAYDPAEGRKCIRAMRLHQRKCGDDATDDIDDACDRVYH